MRDNLIGKTVTDVLLVRGEGVVIKFSDGTQVNVQKMVQMLALESLCLGDFGEKKEEM